jgi:hypothetical protein
MIEMMEIIILNGQLQKAVSCRRNGIYTTILAILDLFGPVNEIEKKLGSFNVLMEKTRNCYWNFKQFSKLFYIPHGCLVKLAKNFAAPFG